MINEFRSKDYVVSFVKDSEHIFENDNEMKWPFGCVLQNFS